MERLLLLFIIYIYIYIKPRIYEISTTTRRTDNREASASQHH